MVSTWTSKDDEVLKNAIEAGTSLKSLSKDAVQFSRRFTLQELKDQWNSQTYYDNSSVEPCLHSIECVEYKGEISGIKRRMNNDARDLYSPLLKRVRSSVVENRDNTKSMDYMYGEAKQHHFGSTVSNSESVHQHLPKFVTVCAAVATARAPCGFEEASQSVPKEADQASAVPMFWLNDPFCSEAETLVEFNGTRLTYGDIDVGNFGDIFTLPQIPTQNTDESISEQTLPERQVEMKESAANSEHQIKEKESAENSADFHNIGDANNYELLGCDVQSNTTDQIPFYNMENLAPSTDGNLAGSSAPFMELRELEEFLFTDTDENDTADIPGLDSFLSDFSWEVNISKHCNIPGDDVNYGRFMNYSSESAMLTLISAANPELPNCISDNHTLPSAPAANNHEHHIACGPEGHLSVPPANFVVYTSCVPEAQILRPSKPNVDPDLLCNGVICCVLNTEDTEIPCNDDALFTNDDGLFMQPSRRCSGSSRSSSKKKHLLRGIKAYYLAETMKVKPDSSETTTQSKKALYKAENNKENPGLSQTIQRKKALYLAENIQKDPDSSEMIQSDILSDLGINLPFIKRGD